MKPENLIIIDKALWLKKASKLREHTQSDLLNSIYSSAANCIDEIISSSKPAEDISIRFIEWMNFPIYQAPRSLSFQKRATAQFPDYKTYVIIDEKGKNILPAGKFLSPQELFEEFLKTLENEDKTN